MSSKAQRKRRRRDHRFANAPRLNLDATVDVMAAELEAEDGGDKPPTFRMVANTGRPMNANSPWAEPVVVNLAGIEGIDQTRPVLLSHDPSQIVGHTTAITASSRQLTADGIVSGAGDAAEQVIVSAKRGFPWKASVGLSVLESREVVAGETVKVNGRVWNGPLVVAERSVMQEISMLPIAADDRTSVRVAASVGDDGMDENFIAWLEAKGFVVAELDDLQTDSLEAAWRAENTAPPQPQPAGPTEPQPEDAGAAARQQIAAEQQRSADIAAVIARYGVDTIEHEGQPVNLQAHAVRTGMDVRDVELHCLRRSRPRAPAAHSRGTEQDCTLDALQASMILRAGLALDDPVLNCRDAMHYDLPRWARMNVNADARQQAMEMGHRYSDLSMLELCEHAIRLDGGAIPSGRRARIQAAFSGGNLTNIFTTNVNTVILSTYTQTEDTTMGWTQERDVADFKTNERPRMQTGPDLAKLPRGGTADHATRTDQEETYKVARYARQFVVDEQDIIDDSFNAIMDMPTQFGAAARRLRPDLVYSILFANAALGADSVALFHATHANLATTATLASGTLKTALTAMAIQQENSVNLNIRATHAIVPETIRWTLDELLNSTMVAYGGDNPAVVQPTTNVLRGVVSPVSDARLDNGVTDPASGTVHAGATGDWFLASSMAHTIEVGYIRGTGRQPSIRSFVLDRGQWGIGWDINMDIGAKALDYRGLYKAEA